MVGYQTQINEGTPCHSSRIYNECHTHSAKVADLPLERAYQDNVNDTQHPMCEYHFQVWFHVGFALLTIKAYVCRFILIHSKGKLT